VSQWPRSRVTGRSDRAEIFAERWTPLIIRNLHLAGLPKIMSTRDPKCAL
jgi:hypothetical protein